MKAYMIVGVLCSQALLEDISQGDAPRNCMAHHRITAVHGIVVGTKHPGASHEGIHDCRCSV